MMTSTDTGQGQSSISATPATDKHTEPRTLRFVGIDDFRQKKDEQEIEADKASAIKLLTHLSRASLGVSVVLFLCLAGAAVCLCRPVAVLGGILVSMLFLSQGILGTYVVKMYSQTLLIGFACLSGFVFLSGLGSALFLLSGQFTVACVSSFHTFSNDSETRLRVVESIALLGSIPCLMGAVSCFLSSVIAARGSKRPKTRISEPQLFLYLHPNEGNQSSSPTEKLRNQKVFGTFPSAPGSQDIPNIRESTPPPSYNQFNEESYA